MREADLLALHERFPARYPVLLESVGGAEPLGRHDVRLVRAALLGVALILRPDDFYSDANQRVFGHMLAVHEQGRRLDWTLLEDRLRRALADLDNLRKRYEREVARERAAERALVAAMVSLPIVGAIRPAASAGVRHC